ncbi:Tyrosinase co-factor MelC1 [Streptomyces sp. ADI96-02]|uniref:tyrosinase family oxidase copper chaperone n=1 Tax=unclassified Streptomyces TaxID=2593676 RepID=UPI000F556B71|nr:tyrosinase family oxidase copper chaperone [Streptomyces sp. ADI96-02]RPK54697.1 Tyrosinase co-factor MelC1 [Streptomyces sp. ADI96-02]
MPPAPPTNSPTAPNSAGSPTPATDRADAPPATSGTSRRVALRTAFTAAAVAGAAAVLLPVLDREAGSATRSAPGPAADRPDRGRATERFAETYRGREIRGTATDVVPAGRGLPSGQVTEVLIDGRPLHVMRRADGTYLSEVRHYESYPTLLETARAAVDELGSARLRAPSHSM